MKQSRKIPRKLGADARWVVALMGALLPVLLCPASWAAVRVQRNRQSVTVISSDLRLECDLTSGRVAVEWPTDAQNHPALRGMICAARLADGTALSSPDYTHHDCLPSDVTPIRDEFGNGAQIVIRHRTPGKPELRQTFRVYADRPYLFVRLAVIGTRPLTTDDISPLILDDTQTPGAGLFLDAGTTPRTLFVPYDNDAWIRYNSDSSSGSYEVTAVYDNTSRHGFVLGSITHDLWKTGMTFADVGNQHVGGLRVHEGAAGPLTHDTQSPGAVTGRVIHSSQIFVGFFKDWRDGMETYGRANAHIQPPLGWQGGVPFGWNSWAAYKETVSDARYLAASDFFKTSLQPLGFENKGSVYINFDSFWDNLSDAQIEAAVRHVHANGQKAGIYWTPFVCWGGDLSRTVEGTGGRSTYQDILLKDAAGKPLPKLDGGMPLDPTHPGTLARIDWQLHRFVQWGFDFVKLDFLTHGALEGAHFDPRVTTGTAAYNLGMARIDADLAPSKIHRPFFISLSIAPLFPSGYGHSRRVSCDAFGRIDQTEYMLNSLTYGWWASGTLYRFNDPDHTVLYQEHGQPPTTEAEGRTRLNASVIAGTVMLDSDDLTDPAAQARAARLLSNHEIDALARSGRSFQPVEGDTGTQAADVFVRHDSDTGAGYVAVFNYSKTDPASKHLDLARLGFSGSKSYQTHDLWADQDARAHHMLTVDLAPMESKILRLTPVK